MQKSQWKWAGKDSTNCLKTEKTNQNVLEDKEDEQLFYKEKSKYDNFLLILIFLISKNVIAYWDLFSGTHEQLFLDGVNDVMRLL